MIVASAETLLEDAILAALAADEDVARELGAPVRVLRDGARPFYPFLEWVRHDAEPADATGVDALRHRIDLRIHTRLDGEKGARDLLAHVRRVIEDADLTLSARRVVYCYPVFADVLSQRGVNLWRGTLRLKALTTTDQS